MSVTGHHLESEGRAGKLRAPTPPPNPLPEVPITLPLSHARSCDPDIAGGRASSLARAAVAGLPALPGFVITTFGCRTIRAAGGLGSASADALSIIEAAWATLSHDGRRSLVVRPSSTGEDDAESSMARGFTYERGVGSWDEFLSAVQAVLDSTATDPGAGAPLAVVVQPELPCHLAGLMCNGRLLDFGGEAKIVSVRLRRRLASMGHHAAQTFGGPQSIEWGVDQEGQLWMLESRPATAVSAFTAAADRTESPARRFRFPFRRSRSTCGGVAG